jgi:hypothetical protein
VTTLDNTGDVRTVRIPGNGTGTISYELPPGITFDLQTVLAEIDATGAGDTRATVTLLEQAGTAIASVPQSRVIPGGDTGRATWALRLADDGGSGTAVVAPSWRAALILENGTAQVMGVVASVTDNVNTLAFGLGRTPLVAVWKLGVGATVEANVVNLDTVAHKYSMGPVNVQETATGAQETLRGNTITVAGSNVGSFSFGPRTFGAVLLNLANPLIPTIVNAGTYAITAQIGRTP